VHVESAHEYTPDPSAPIQLGVASRETGETGVTAERMVRTPCRP
jgi:hypothetical protein